MPDSSDVLRRGRFWDRCLNWLAVGVIVIVVPVAFWWLIEPAREAGRRASCMGHLKMIGLAMLNYDAELHGFPPAYLVDRQERPAHSWRVALLPYLGGCDVQDRYRFAEPWNSPHNAALAQGAPSGMASFYPLYHCPSDRYSSKWDTSYVMVVGPNTISAGPTSTGMKDITDGISNTILVAEMCDSGIHWMEPRDLPAEQMSFKINDPEYVGIASRHGGGAIAGFADGHAQFLSEKTNPEAVQGITTINGGERVGKWLDEP